MIMLVIALIVLVGCLIVSLLTTTNNYDGETEDVTIKKKTDPVNASMFSEFLCAYIEVKAVEIWERMERTKAINVKRKAYSLGPTKQVIEKEGV